eukprot:TRINITY_DN14295_c0_g1_i1.p1 TRINITY_DN14295_c0_g1~~TRINITY_DN14295_c0_g1_i1.p1  ORF type:complete len:285 (+),score=58.45 TRINITY_DN14295_c0_g1_i1:86-940(+)
MSFKPVQYADLGKKSKDILTEKYVSDVKVELKTTVPSGPALTLNGFYKGDGAVTSDAEAKYTHGSSGLSVKAKHEVQAAKTKVEFTLDKKPLPAGKLQFEEIFKGQNLESAKLTYSYSDKVVAANASADLKKKVLTSAVVLGSQGLSLGVDAAYNLDKKATTKTDLTLGYAADDLVLNASLTEGFGVVGVNYYQKVEKYTKNDTTVAAEYAYKRADATQTFTVGLLTKLKAYDSELRLKANQAGKVQTVVVGKVHDKVTLSLGAEVEAAKPCAPKFALALAFSA